LSSAIASPPWAFENGMRLSFHPFDMADRVSSANHAQAQTQLEQSSRT
jgi:hypothetical protein